MGQRARRPAVCTQCRPLLAAGSMCSLSHQEGVARFASLPPSVPYISPTGTAYMHTIRSPCRAAHAVHIALHGRRAQVVTQFSLDALGASTALNQFLSHKYDLRARRHALQVGAGCWVLGARAGSLSAGSLPPARGHSPGGEGACGCPPPARLCCSCVALGCCLACMWDGVLCAAPSRWPRPRCQALLWSCRASGWLTEYPPARPPAGRACLGGQGVPTHIPLGPAGKWRRRQLSHAGAAGLPGRRWGAVRHAVRMPGCANTAGWFVCRNRRLPCSCACARA